MGSPPVGSRAAAAAFQAARFYAKLGQAPLAVKYLDAAIENDPSLRGAFRTELARESSDWSLLREDRRLEQLIGER